MIIQFMAYVLDLIALVPKTLVLGILLLVGLDDQLLKIADLLMQVSVDVFTFRFRHFQHSITLGIQNLDLFFAEIELFPRLINIFL